MFGRAVVACALVTWGGLSASAQVTPLSRDLNPSRTALSRIGLERGWYAGMPLGAGERIIEISTSDGLFFAQSNLGGFHVLDAETGRKLWSINLGVRSYDAFPASASKNTVYVTNSNYLHAIDRKTGRPIWNVLLPGLPSSATAISPGLPMEKNEPPRISNIATGYVVPTDGEIVMVGLASGKVYAYTLVKQTVHHETTTEELTVPTQVWNWQAGGPMTARPVAANRVVAFAGYDGRSYVVMRDERTPVNRFVTGGPIVASMGTHDTRTLIIASMDYNIYAVDLFTANQKWVFPTGSPALQEPLISDSDVYVVNERGILTSLDVESGKPRWSVPTLGGPLLALSPTRIYLESRDGDIFIVDRKSGAMIAEPRVTFERAGVRTREYSMEITNSENDRLYFGTEYGQVLCLREIGATQPRPLRKPGAKPFGYIPPEGDPKFMQGQTGVPADAQSAADAEAPKPDADAPKADGDAPKPDADAPKADGDAPKPE